MRNNKTIKFVRVYDHVIATKINSDSVPVLNTLANLFCSHFKLDKKESKIDHKKLLSFFANNIEKGTLIETNESFDIKFINGAMINHPKHLLIID